MRSLYSSSFWAGSIKLGLEIFNCGWVVFDCLALVEEGTEVLHGVGAWLTASLRVEVNQVAVAIELGIGGWKWEFLNLDLVDEEWEHALKGLVSPESMLQFSLQSLLVLNRWISHDLGVEIVKLDISDANSEVVLLRDLLSCVT